MELSEEERQTTDRMLNDIYFRRDSQINIAKKYGYTPGYISQIQKKFNQILSKPLVKNDILLCSVCESPENLVFQISKSNEVIALVCKSCRRKLKGNGAIDKLSKPSVNVNLTNTKLIEDYNLLMDWIIEGKLGYTSLMSKKEQQQLEEMDKVG